MRSTIVLLLAAAALFGQDTALVRLKREAALVKASAKDDSKEPSVTALHRALRDWIEARLPEDKGLLSVKSASLESSLQAELTEAGLDEPDAASANAADDDYFDLRGLGSVSIELTQFPELPDTLFVTAGAGVRCGVDEAVYGYHFDTLGRTSILQDIAEGYSFTTLQLSDPDAAGRRLLLIHRMSVQCASTWMGLAYSVYRMGFLPGIAEPLFSEKQSFWLNDGPEFVLKPEELILEFLDFSVDTGVHNRTKIHRYRFSNSVQRLDPIAFQPQDFAEEWLTRPWSEMQSRSAPATADWHSKLHADFVMADYSAVVPCVARPGRWMIALDITNIGEKKLDEPLETYFLVRELGNYRYQMESVSDERPAGCPGQSFASDKHPWLSPAELKVLR
jgi:hypothetical protein